jgi:integrase
VTGFDPARGRSIQRSFTVHGDAALAGKARRELVAGYGLTCAGLRHAAPAMTVGELLESYLGSAQLWKPATAVSHRHVVSALLNDPLCRCRLQALTPAVMRAAICRWRGERVSVPKVSARWLLLRAAVSWAVAGGLLRLNPLAGMRGPPRPRPRRHHSVDEVRRLLAAAGGAVASAEDAFRCRPGSAACARRLFAAGQLLLLVRLAADCGARRGELAALRLSYLDGRVLTIERSLSAGILGPTKSGRTRRVTLGSGTAEMIRRHVRAWAARVAPEGDWLFSPSPRRPAHLTAGALSRRLTGLGEADTTTCPRRRVFAPHRGLFGPTPEFAESALENGQVKDSRAAPISAIPVCGAGQAGIGDGRWAMGWQGQASGCQVLHALSAATVASVRRRR